MRKEEDGIGGAFEGNDTILAARIREMLKVRGLTPNHVSVRAGRHRTTVSHFLKRPNGTMHDETVRKIARILGCQAAYLRGESDDMGAPEPNIGLAIEPPLRVVGMPSDTDAVPTLSVSEDAPHRVRVQLDTLLKWDVAVRVIELVGREGSKEGGEGR